jgi:hypothetical protein
MSLIRKPVPSELGFNHLPDTAPVSQIDTHD